MDQMTTAYQDMIKVHGWVGTAAQMNMTRSQLEARVYEVKGSGMRVATAQLLQRISGTKVFAQAVAEDAGGVFVEMPAVQHGAREALMSKFLELQSRLGDLTTAYTKAAEDDVIDSAERRELSGIETAMHKTLCELMATMYMVHCRKPTAIPD